MNIKGTYIHYENVSTGEKKEEGTLSLTLSRCCVGRGGSTIPGPSSRPSEAPSPDSRSQTSSFYPREPGRAWISKREP